MCHADTMNHRVLVVDPDTSVATTFAGQGTAGNSGDGGAATEASLNGPWATAFDNAGNVYIAEFGGNVSCVVRAPVCKLCACRLLTKLSAVEF